MSINVTAGEVRTAAYGLTIPTGTDIDASILRLVAKAIDRLPGGRTGIEARIAASSLSESLVRGVIEDMVIRVLRNPRAIRSSSIDDFTETIDNSVSAGELYLSASEAALLTAGSDRPRVGTIRLGLAAWRVPGG